jgi:hypothetical protein
VYRKQPKSSKDKAIVFVKHEIPDGMSGNISKNRDGI